MTVFLSPESVVERVAQIQQTLPTSVRLIAVSKTIPIPLMRAAYAAGIRDFGESQIQEATQKQKALQDLPDITWHFIGHLQGNKARRAIEQFQWIHSVDSLKLAQRLDQYMGESGHSPLVCLQVKPCPDPSKYGWSFDELKAALPYLDQCSHLPIRGLMTILPLYLKEDAVLPAFQSVTALAEELRHYPWQHQCIQHLSMGMSDDYPWAIEAGSTMVRLGRILFGSRG